MEKCEHSQHSNRMKMFSYFLLSWGLSVKGHSGHSKKVSSPLAEGWWTWCGETWYSLPLPLMCCKKNNKQWELFLVIWHIHIMLIKYYSHFILGYLETKMKICDVIACLLLSHMLISNTIGYIPGRYSDNQWHIYSCTHIMVHCMVWTHCYTD